MKNWLLFTLGMAVVFRFAAHSAELVRKVCPVSGTLIDPSAHPAVRHAAEPGFFTGKATAGVLPSEQFRAGGFREKSSL